MIKRQKLTISDHSRLSQHRSGLIAEPLYKMLHTTDKNKIKKILKIVCDNNPRFSKYCGQTNVMEIRAEQLQEAIRRMDDWVALGLIQLFERMEDLKIKELQKQTIKMQDEILYYSKRKQNERIDKEGIASITVQDHETQGQKIMGLWNPVRLSEEISSFEEKYGKMWLISRKNRVLCDLIDKTHNRIAASRVKPKK